MPSEIESTLRAVHAPRVEPPAEDPALEREILGAWARRYAAGEDAGGERAPGGFAALFAIFAAHRLAVGLGAALLLIVAACVMPTAYEVPLGLGVQVEAPVGEELPAREIAAFVRETSGAAEIDVIVRQVHRDGEQPQTRMMIRLWDQDLAVGELGPQLRARFPEALAAARIDEQALEGEVETIWARRLAHRTFERGLREADVEEARAQLLARLQAQGYDEREIVVKVRDRPDGHREVELRIERHLEGEGEPPELGPLPEHGLEWVLEGEAEAE